LDDGEKMKRNKAMQLAGCCGLYCGLCGKYQSKSPSRCIGCRQGEQHSWCSIWNCCVKKHGFETCTECGELFECAIFKRRKVPEWVPAAENLNQIKERGLENWLNEQKERQALLEGMLHDFNEGRSMSLYCKAASRMPTDSIRAAIKEAKEKMAREKIDKSDLKSKARIFKEILKDLISRLKLNLD
jgi:hypothetical protein